MFVKGGAREIIGTLCIFKAFHVCNRRIKEINNNSLHHQRFPCLLKEEQGKE
jgi:hypothetical protein